VTIPLAVVRRSNLLADEEDPGAGPEADPNHENSNGGGLA
jgi:hypothetical protein